MTRSSCLVVLVALVGCGGIRRYQPGGSVRLDQAAGYEIDDEEIARAFGARPQMPTPLNVAYFSFESGHNQEIESMLSAIEGVEGVYAIPRVMVTGQRRFQTAEAGQQLSLRRLRLLAARAQCDVVVVFDYGYRVERRPNGLAVLNILLIPALFTPFMDAEVTSYLETHVIDTRNGYVYGQIESEEEGEQERLNIWSNADEELAEEHWQGLLASTRALLTSVVAEH
ncbi:MAG: hypothetical protein AAGE52_35400 [Myxococcota bacterium]